MSKKNIVIVGGGISGILSALLIKRHDNDVHIIEQAPILGGLLQSSELLPGYFVDKGTHLIPNTGYLEIDKLIHGEFESWISHKNLKVGHYFSNKLNEQTSFIDTTLLNSTLANKGTVELLKCATTKTDNSNLYTYLNTTYGTTFTEFIFRPVLKKYFGCHLEELNAESNKLFGLSKLLILDPEITELLKSIPQIDKIIAFHSNQIKDSSTISYYPATGGVQQWITSLEKKLVEKNIQVYKNTSLKSIKNTHTHITDVRTNSNIEIKCDHLIWTIAPVFLLKLLKPDYPLAPNKPNLRTTRLVHFAFDKPFLTELFYFSIFQPDFYSTRVTLYPNLTKSADQKIYHCTVEVIGRDDISDTKLIEKIYQELLCTEIINLGHQVVKTKHEVLSAGFPTLTPSFTSLLAKQVDLITTSYDNAILLGKGKGDSFFMRDILIETYKILSSHFQVR